MLMNTEHTTEKEHNRKTDEEEVEKIKAELEMAVEKVTYFENLIIAADSLRKLAETKIIQTQSKKLDEITNKLDSQIQSLGELIRKAETKREEAINKLLDAEVSLIVVENRILHSKVTNF
jgi:ethanolamine ammonia-lyase small subunit